MNDPCKCYCRCGTIYTTRYTYEWREGMRFLIAETACPQCYSRWRIVRTEHDKVGPIAAHKMRG